MEEGEEVGDGRAEGLSAIVSYQCNTTLMTSSVSDIAACPPLDIPDVDILSTLLKKQSSDV